MTAVQHIAFNCRDLRAQERFYSKHFGFRRARVFNAGRADEFLMLRLGSICLELFQATGASATTQGAEQPVGFKHLAFAVDDLDAAVRAIQADGIATDEIIDCSSIVNGLRICFFNDPDGNRVELMQGFQDQ
ncbi:MAG: VOC family protein [bacterium]